MKADGMPIPSPSRHKARKCKLKKSVVSTSRPRFYGNGPVGVTKNMTRKKLEALFDRPVEQAAKFLGISTTIIKRLCRRHGIPRWPYRQLIRIDAQIKSTESSIALLLDKESGAKLSYGGEADLAQYLHTLESLRSERRDLVFGKGDIESVRQSESTKRNSRSSLEAQSRSTNFAPATIKFEAMLMENGPSNHDSFGGFDFLWHHRDPNEKVSNDKSSACDSFEQTLCTNIPIVVTHQCPSESLSVKCPDELQRAIVLPDISFSPFDTNSIPTWLPNVSSLGTNDSDRSKMIKQSSFAKADQAIFTSPHSFKRFECWAHCGSFDEICNLSNAELEAYLIEPVPW